MDITNQRQIHPVPKGPEPGISPETVAEILHFRDERNWKQFHTPKDLAISLCLEAAELLEVFQWSGSDTSCTDKMDKVREELADVLSYSILMASACGLELNDILREKVARNAEKYPAALAYGSKAKYSELKQQADLQRQQPESTNHSLAE